MASLESTISFEIPCAIDVISMRALEQLYRTLCEAMQARRDGNYDFCYTTQRMQPGEQRCFWIDDKSVLITVGEQNIGVQVVAADDYAAELKKGMEKYITELPRLLTYFHQ